MSIFHFNQKNICRLFSSRHETAVFFQLPWVGRGNVTTKALGSPAEIWVLRDIRCILNQAKLCV